MIQVKVKKCKYVPVISGISHHLDAISLQSKIKAMLNIKSHLKTVDSHRRYIVSINERQYKRYRQDIHNIRKWYLTNH